MRLFNLNKNINAIALIAICVILLVANGCNSQNLESNLSDLPRLIPYKDGNKWGYCDKNKKIVIPCIYETHYFFDKNGLALVGTKAGAKSDRMNLGVIDSLGNIVVPLIFEEGKSKFLFIKYDGKNKQKFGNFKSFVYHSIQIVILSSEFEISGHNFENFTISNDPNNPIVYAKDLGSIIIQNIYEKNAKVYNRYGINILPDSFEIVGRDINEMSLTFYNNYFIAKNSYFGYFQIFNSSGKPITGHKYLRIHYVNDTVYEGTDKNSTGLYNLKGNLLALGEFNHLGKNKDYLNIRNKYGETFYSLKFNEFIGEPIFNKQNSYKFCKNYVIVPIINKKVSYSIYDYNKGSTDIKNYDIISPDLAYGYIIAKRNKDVYLYNKNYSLLNVFTNTDTIIPILKNKFWVKTNNLCGIWLLDEKKFSIEPIYENIDFSYPNIYIAQTKDKKVRVLDTVGKMMFSDSFVKFNVVVQEQKINKISQNFKNLNNKANVEIMPFRLPMGRSFTISYLLIKDTVYYDNEDYLRFFSPIYEKDDYDEILNKLKMITNTVVLEDINGIQYFIDNNLHKVKLPSNYNLLARVDNILFLENKQNKQIHYTNLSDINLHEIRSYNINYCNNEPIIIVAEKMNNNINYFQLNKNGIRNNFNFKELELIQGLDDVFCLYGKTDKFNMIFNSEMQIKIPSNFQLNCWVGDYGIIESITKENEVGLALRDGNQTMFSNCIINPTIYPSLYAINKINGDNRVFVGYADVYGIKYYN